MYIQITNIDAQTGILCTQSPVPYPQDEKQYYWDEPTST
jgi:hypothetical protein